ncbi:MAG: DNA polymerase III subunit delta [bacterium]
MKQQPLAWKRSGARLASQIYLFYGEEDFLIQERIKEIKKKFSDSSFSLERISARADDLSPVISALQTQPLLLGDKCVIIKDLEIKGEAVNSLVPGLQAIAPGITVVIWAKSVDRRSKLFKLLDKIGEVCEFKSYADWEQAQVVNWIIGRVKSQGKTIQPQAAESLQQICGNGLQKLASEIEKLITYIGREKQIQEQDVVALASPGQTNVFALSDALMQKDIKRSLSNFRALCKNRVDLFPLLGLLAANYRTMLQVKGAERGSNPALIARQIGANPFFVKKCLSKSQLFDEAELKKNLELLLETDLKLKTGEQALPVIELLLTTLCQHDG